MTLLMTGVARAGLESPVTAGRETDGVAPNQSVSLDAIASGAAAQAAGQAPDQDESALLEVADAEVVEQPSAESTIPLRYVRPRLPAAATALLGGESPPWYRTGLGSLAIVLAVVGVVYLLVRRWMPGVRSIESGALCVTGRAALTPKHSAALIQLGRRFVLVGVSPDRVSLLCEVSDPGEVAELAARTGSPSAEGRRVFDRLLTGEAAEYCMEAKPASAEHSQRGTGKAPRPLGDLLNRLRVLQTK